jgi:hypothetical protein
MSLGVLPQIIATVTTVGPTVYGLVDAYQQRKRENQALLAKAAAEHGAPAPSPLPQRAEWVVPVVSAVVASGGVSYLLWWWYKKHGKGKRKGKRSEADE